MTMMLRHTILLLLAATLMHAAPVHVDLPTVMMLAGANNDEIQLAKTKHTEVLAESKLAWQRFWPSLTLGAGYRRTDGNVQDIAGAVFDVSKQQYTVGPNLMIDWSPGTCITRRWRRNSVHWPRSSSRRKHAATS